MDDLISRQAAIDALWKALYEYEDKTEKQFIDSEELDVADWIQHRIFAQNMSDIDRQTILGLPSAQPDLDSAYTEGYTAAESKYRKMWDEMQANIKEKAFGKRKGLIHTADIDAMPTIEERKTGKWIPCKREQPTIDGKYNVTIRDGVFGRYVTELWYGKPTLPMNGAGGKRGWFETTPDGDYWYDGVIAWMPLPEPWKGEQP